MKTIYLLLVTFALAVFTQSEPKHPKAEHLHHVCLHSKNAAPAYIYIHSVEEYDQDGNFTIEAVIRAEDTTFFHADSVWFTDTAIYSFEISGLSGAYTLYPGDSLELDITGTYNPANMPFSYTNSYIGFKLLTADSLETFGSRGFKVYHTPYGTTEIWNAEDFEELPRAWEVYDSIVPTRVYVNPLDIPISNRNVVTDSSEDWEFDFQLYRMEGLPYAVEMAAAHPDSLAAYALRDSLDEHDTSLMHTSAVRHFTGSVTGRLSVRMRNDNNEEFTLRPAGVKVRLREDDLWGDEVGFNGLNRNLAETFTADDGTFMLEYDTWQPFWEGGEIELYLEIIAEDNKHYDIQVRRTVSGPYRAFRGLGSVGQDNNMNIGDWFVNGDPSFPFRTFHYARNVFRFCEAELGGNILSKGLDIKLNKRGSFYVPYPTKTIRLEALDDRHESVIYHEMGHFVMGELQGGFPNPQCLFLNHAYTIEINHVAAWTEGWANGFAAMLDLAFSQEDGEFGRDAFFEGGLWPGTGNLAWFPMELRRTGVLNRTGPLNPPAGNGFRSEYHIATALYDLFDGPANFPATPAGDAEWNDAPNLFDGYTLGSDNVCLSFYDIVEPMRNTGGSINSIADYFERLVVHLRNKDNDWCGNIVDVRHVFQENRVSFDISNENYVRTSLSSNLYQTGDVWTFANHFNRIETLDEVCILLGNETFPTQINRIEGLNESFNFIAKTSYESVWLNDPLEIADGATIWCNAEREAGWFNSGDITPFTGSTLDLLICNGETVIDEGGVLEVGNSDDINFSNLIIKPYTNLIIRSGGKLVVNDGSSVLIDHYANLIFEEGALIELSGSNSVLEIRGRLELGENANFQTIGSGKVRFNMAKYPGTSQYNIITNGNNCEFTFSGKNIEVASGTFVYPMDNMAMFTIVACTVDMGEDAFLNIGCQVTLAGSVFRKIQSLPGLYVHAGIKLYGQHVDAEGRVVISECWFKDAKYGVRAYQTPGGNSTKITGCTFTQCEKPLMIYDRGAYLFANTFDDCYRGVYSELTTNYFNVEANVFSGIDIIGFMNISQPGSRAIIAGNVFKDNYQAMFFNRTIASIRCNAIYRNYIAGYSENLSSYFARRYLGAQYWYHEGGENLYEEGLTGNYGGNWLHFEGNSLFHFIDGYNHFKRVNNNNSVFSISGTSLIRPFNSAYPIDVRFENNYWTPHMALMNSSVPDFLSLNPSGIHNPHFYIKVKNAATQPVFVYGAALSSFSGCTVPEWTGPIANKDNYTPGSIPGVLFKKLPDEGLLNHDLIYNPVRIVPSGVYQGQELGTALRAALEGTHAGMDYDKDSVDIIELLNLGDLVLNTIGPLDNLMDDDYIYNEYMSAINSSISGGLINSSNQATYIAQIEEIIDEKLDAIAGMEYSYPEAYYSYRFSYNLDLAYLYRSFGKYTEALSQLGYLETFANERDLNLVNGVSCYINQEKGLRDSTISLFDFSDSVTFCSNRLDSLYIRVMEPLDSFPGLGEDPEILSYVLSPNPTSSYLNLSLDLDVDAYIEIRIYSKTGNLLLSDIWGNKNSGIYNESYNVSSYYEDVYIFVVFADGMPFSQNFIISLPSGH